MLDVKNIKNVLKFNDYANKVLIWKDYSKSKKKLDKKKLKLTVITKKLPDFNY